MHDPQSVSVNLQSLTALFYPDPAELGQFSEVLAEQMPAVYRQLLSHENHMTVTVEKHHHDSVEVVVLDRNITPSHYARKIVLCRQRDHEVVQFGLMRVNYAHLSPTVRDEIENEDTPLGRILIDHNVLRSIHLVSLYRIVPGDDLNHFFGLQSETAAVPQDSITTYGRTAIIFCNEEPAVELLEIIVPEVETSVA